jgi:hypothetical protein
MEQVRVFMGEARRLALSAHDPASLAWLLALAGDQAGDATTAR